jgi:hypothetical protein
VKGLNLSRFQKVASDEHSTTMRHPDGHEFRIAHKTLSPKMRKDLNALPMTEQKLEGGGEVYGKPLPKPASYVKDYPSPKTMDPQSSEAKQNLAAAESESANIDHTWKQGTSDRMKGNKYGGYASGGKVKYYKDGSTDAPVGEEPSQNPASSITADAGTPSPVVVNVNSAPPASPQGQNFFQQAGRALAYTPGGGPESEAMAEQPIGKDVAPLGTPPPATAPAQAADPAAAPAPQSGLFSPTMNAIPPFDPAGIYAEGQKAIGLQQQAEQTGARERLKADEDYARTIAERQFNYAQGLQEKQQEIDAAVKDYGDGHINPNHFVESKSTVGMVSTAIGLILGGIGAGMTHGENQALKFLNAQIDRDIESQKADLNKKQTMIGAYQKQYDNMATAEHMTRATELAIYSAHLDQAAAKAADPAAAARAAQASMALKSQIPTLLQQAQTVDMMRSIGRPGTKVDLMDLARVGIIPKEYHEQLAKETNSINRQQGAVEGIKDIYDQYRKEQTAGNLANPQSYKRVGALNGRLVNLIMEASPSKRLTEESVKQEIAPFMVKTSDTDATIDKKMGGVFDMVKRNSDPTPIAEKYGVFHPDSLYSTKKQPQQAPEGATGTYQGKPVIFRGGRWQPK